MATDSLGPVARRALFATLPPEWPDAGLEAKLVRAVAANGRKVVVLDDDPTGSQTMHDIDVLTTWGVEELRAALLGPDRTFYILTNSRSLPVNEAVALNAEVATNLAAARRATGVEFELVSRSDSTLRGHYPAEIDALQATVERELADERRPAFDGQVLLPFFGEGGRYTIGNVHWVADGEWLLPAGQTEYARDLVFGYRSSDLREWVAEKTGGRIPPEEVRSITLEDLRLGGPARVAESLARIGGGRPVIVNCAGYSDLRVFIAGLLEAEAAGQRFLFRTGASFVKQRSALPDRAPLGPAELGIAAAPSGGLVVVGSYIRKSGDQLRALLGEKGLVGVELDVLRVLDAPYGRGERAAEIERVRAGCRASPGRRPDGRSLHQPGACGRRQSCGIAPHLSQYLLGAGRGRGTDRPAAAFRRRQGRDHLQRRRNPCLGRETGTRAGSNHARRLGMAAGRRKPLPGRALRGLSRQCRRSERVGGRRRGADRACVGVDRMRASSPVPIDLNSAHGENAEHV